MSVLLRTARKRAGLTQDQLAAKSGVDQTTISRLEIDPHPNPTLLTRDRLARALGIRPERLAFTGSQVASTDEQQVA